MSAAVYGGDEINAIVLDAGSSHTRIGYAGDDFPKIITPSQYGLLDGKTLFGGDFEHPRSGLEIKNILEDSVIQDWDAAVAQYKHYFDNVLRLDYAEQPILITEPVWTEKEYRQKLVETFYESFDFPALYLARSPTCVSFQQGRLSCLVVDIGHSSVSVVPVVDGICLLKSSMKTNYAGQFLNDLIRERLKSKYPDLSLVAKYTVKDKKPTSYPAEPIFTPRTLPENITQLFDSYQQAKVFTEFKELLLEVPDKKLHGSNSQTSAILREQYGQDDHKRAVEAPSGQLIDVGLDRFEIADALFDPASYSFEDPELAAKYAPNNGELLLSSLYDNYRPVKRAKKAELGQSTPTPSAEPSQTTTIRGISHLVSHTLSSVDIDLRASVAHNVIVTGGSSLIPNLVDRLNNELTNANPGLKIRVNAMGNAMERVNQAWIGGSVLSSLGTFHQMWVSKAEYEEAGADRILMQRFR